MAVLPMVAQPAVEFHAQVLPWETQTRVSCQPLLLAHTPWISRRHPALLTIINISRRRDMLNAAASTWLKPGIQP